MINAISDMKVGLKERWHQFRAENPAIRIRDAAFQLGVSEAELLATEIGKNCIRLNNNFAELLQEMHKLGQIMALTRNTAIVHERKGIYKDIEILQGHGKMGLVVSEDIDLRIFFNNWHFGFAVETTKSSGTLRSFQFFDIDGTAIHKVYLSEKSDLEEYQKLIEKFRNKSQRHDLKAMPKPAKSPETPDVEIDVKGFRTAWASMKDTHDFFGLTRKFGVSRLQALRLAEREMAFQVPLKTYRDILEKASAAEMPIMIFVGNPGVIQIHTGKVQNIVEARGWLNVLDEKFNLHIKQQEINSCWVVRKPTVDGIVTSLELFDQKGENAALFFGKRKPGNPENNEWREIITAIQPVC